MTKPLDGHKISQVSYGVSVTCECGWRSDTHYGNGARASADNEWRSHKTTHQWMDSADRKLLEMIDKELQW